MTDYHNLQNYLSSIRTNPSAEDYNEEGYVVLRRSVIESQALLQQPFYPQESPAGSSEQEKMQLQRIIVDASVRRFRAQRLYLRAQAALRWVNARTQVLQGQRPNAGHAAALQQINNTLRSELASITDSRIDSLLRSNDSNAGKWLREDPTLSQLRSLAGN